MARSGAKGLWQGIALIVRIGIALLLVAGAANAAASGQTEDDYRFGIEDLQHHRWILQSIDGAGLAELAAQLGFEGDAAKAKVPDLDFGEQGFVSGNTGCNQFHGQAKVVDNSLVLSQLATTAMACEGFAGELELRLQLIYRNPLALTRDGNDLLLESADRRLRFKLRDWVQ